ncbi:hypothetical protein ACLOJK_035928 [Asimina triloba]
MALAVKLLVRTGRDSIMRRYQLTNPFFGETKDGKEQNEEEEGREGEGSRGRGDFLQRMKGPKCCLDGIREEKCREGGVRSEQVLRLRSERKLLPRLFISFP